MKTLIYTTDPKSCLSLQTVLVQNGIFCEYCTSENQLFSLSQSETYAAILITSDLSLITLESALAIWKRLGIESLLVVIGKKGGLLNRQASLALGAHYYFEEPYSYTQLITEIKLHEYHRQLIRKSAVKTGYFEIDLLSRMAYCENVFLDLTRVEFDILALLIRMKGISLSRMQIWEEVWGYQDFPLTNIIDVHINRLRQKLPSEVKKLLVTVYGIGYRLHDSA